MAWGGADKADDLIKRGLDMRREGDDQGAEPLLREAYDESHSPRAAAQLGFCEQALGRWPDAETHLAESLRAAGDPWVKKNHQSIWDALVLVKAHIARLEISGEPPGAEVVVNGNVVGQLPLPAPVRVSGGEIVVEVRARDYSSATQKLRVEGGHYQKLQLRAARLPPRVVEAPLVQAPDVDPVVSTPPSKQSAPDDRAANAAGDSEAAGPGRRSLKFISAGLALVSIGIGVYGIMENSVIVKEFNSGCYFNSANEVVAAGFTSQSCVDLANSYELASRIGVVGLIGGGVFAAAGVILWLTEPSAPAKETAAWHCFPTRTADGGAGAGCALSF